MVVSAMIDEIWSEFIASRRRELRDELITQYSPLVRYVVGRLGIPQTSLLDADDLVSYGIIGLINAIDRFDPTRGVRFEAFATARIRGAVIDQLRVLNWLPRSAVARVRQIETALAELEQRLGRPAKEQEAAAEIGVSIQRYRQMLLEMGIVVLSLDAPLGSLMQDDEATSLSDLIEDSALPGPAQQVEHLEILEVLSSAVKRIPERERLLLSLYYREELTMKEISRLMNVSESRVCQLHMQAILRLRSALHLHQENEGINATQRQPAAVSKRKSAMHSTNR
ncbi:MAG: FliA/WhiG family RNA polymerase sigma factor [Ktedonobacteraceae bacterium]